MKYVLITSLAFFSLSAFASDLSFGSFEPEETKINEALDDKVNDLLSFQVKDISERSIANTESEEMTVTDPVAFGSFE